jgi:hypothetical protein
MNYATQNNFDARSNEPNVTENLSQPGGMLELFAEELPAQHDLKASDCFGCIATVSSTAGSTFSTLSSVSTL